MYLAFIPMSEDYVGGRTESGLRSDQNVIMTDVDRVTKEKEELQKEDLPLAKAAGFLLEECRMVLPGIQALFGFQLITVFNSGFFELLSPAERATASVRFIPDGDFHCFCHGSGCFSPPDGGGKGHQAVYSSR